MVSEPRGTSRSDYYGRQTVLRNQKLGGYRHEYGPEAKDNVGAPYIIRGRLYLYSHNINGYRLLGACRVIRYFSVSAGSKFHFQCA